MEKLIKYIDESDDNGNKRAEIIQKEDSENNIYEITEDNLFNEIKLLSKENNIKNNNSDKEENSESLEIIENDNIDNENRNDIIKLIEGLDLNNNHENNIIDEEDCKEDIINLKNYTDYNEPLIERLKSKPDNLKKSVINEYENFKKNNKTTKRKSDSISSDEDKDIKKKFIRYQKLEKKKKKDCCKNK